MTIKTDDYYNALQDITMITHTRTTDETWNKLDKIFNSVNIPKTYEDGINIIPQDRIILLVI